MTKPKEHQVIYSECGKTIWVNSKDDGSCLGRFDFVFGMDIHPSLTEQMEGKDQCLYCTHEKPKFPDLLVFVAEMRSIYGVEIDVAKINPGFVESLIVEDLTPSPIRIKSNLSKKAIEGFKKAWEKHMKGPVNRKKYYILDGEMEIIDLTKEKS